ncbi:hypothetical protein A4H97_33645 [Niastella yeongjuensis]|uniref:Transmembrane protein n=1 Tax=Niastella yeongjuensis TaxID=354355 RepID=A0A1V9EDG1_9BACT|nr:hypothetical protein [Niastella yeongjuensis]OQP44149.1 hypothetical protein A4H97_33645 [Niastella yeongjuensis]SEO50064.1 hypothetical protein SAMN05660816_02868 [Niastella yeongjuensis]
MENNKVSGTQQDMLEMVIKELVEEHAKANRVIEDLVKGINGINNKIDKPALMRTPEPDTSKIQQVIEKCMLEIRLTISTNLNKHKPGRFQLFLESKNKMWVVVTILRIFLLTYAFFLFVYYLAKSA